MKVYLSGPIAGTQIGVAYWWDSEEERREMERIVMRECDGGGKSEKAGVGDDAS